MQYELHGEHRELQTYPPQGSDRIRPVIPAGRPRALRSHPGPCGAPRCCGPRRPRHREAFHGRQHANRPGPRVLHDARRLAGDGRSDAGAGGRPRERRKARRGERSGHGDHPASVPSRRPTADQGNGPPARGYRRATTRAVRRHLSVRAGPGPRTTGEDRRCAGGLPPMGHAGREGLRALRILYFSLGNTVHDRRFLQRIADFGHEVWSLRLSDAGRVHPDEDTSGAGPRASWPKRAPIVKGPEDVPSLLPAFRDVLADVRPAVLHAGPTQSCGYLAALSEFHPFLLMSWGSDLLVDAERSEVWRRATSVALHGSDLLLCDSAAVRTKAHTLLGYDDSRIVQFPWGVDLKEFRPGADDRGLRHEMGWDDSFIVLSTRSWEPLYGIETLTEAFRRAHAKEPPIRLIRLGGGSLASNTQRFPKSNKRDRARISQANRGIGERRADWSRNSEQLRQAYERLAGA